MKVIWIIVTALAAMAATAEVRNVLFILVDDLGRQDLGVEGSVFYETPNVDALARSGVRFENGYSSCQVCSPSRAAIMLGTAPARNKITDWIGAASGKAWKRNDRVLPPSYRHGLPAEDTTIAEALKAHGVKTFFAGKWHLGGKGSDPEDNGFDVNVGGHHRGSPPGGYFSPYNNPKMKDGPPGECLPIRLANETAAFMERNKDSRFFAMLSFYSVHGPIQTSEPLWRKYRDKAEAAGLADTRFKFDRTKAVRHVQDNPVYAGMMESMDDAVGIVLKKLDELGLADTTMVIFTSDNGGVSSGDAFATACLPLRGGKGRQWEGGLRAPYYLRVPGIAKPGSVSSAFATGTDFFPTILDAMGFPQLPDQHRDGVSLIPAAKGDAMPARDLFWHYPHYGNQGGEPSAVIRSGDYKLIHYYEDGRDELYHLGNDLGEKSDLAAAQPELAKTLRAKLDAWLKETDANMPTPDDRFNAAKKQQQLQAAESAETRRLEATAKNYLNPNYKPNKDWWGSSAAGN